MDLQFEFWENGTFDKIHYMIFIKKWFIYLCKNTVIVSQINVNEIFILSMYKINIVEEAILLTKCCCWCYFPSMSSSSSLILRKSVFDLCSNNILSYETSIERLLINIKLKAITNTVCFPTCHYNTYFTMNMLVNNAK